MLVDVVRREAQLPSLALGVLIGVAGVGVSGGVGVSVVGVGMKSNPGVAATMFDALAKNKINIEMISTSDISISCIIKKRFAESAVRTLHEKFGLARRG